MRALVQRLREAAWFADSEEHWGAIRAQIARENHHNILAVSLVFAVMMAIMPLFSPLSAKISAARQWYVIVMVCSLLVYVVALRVKPERVKAVTVLMYVMISLLLVYATVLGTIYATGQIATAYPAFVLASPLLFADRKRRIAACIAIHTALFVCMAVLFDESGFVVDDVINSCLFAGISVVINANVLNTKFRQEYTQIRLEELSGKDLLTGSRNRNSYEQALARYPHACAHSLACVFADLNGLHELNATIGHAGGDAMLKCVGNAMRVAFGEEDTYRIGGDEFVSFAPDIDDAELQSRVRAVRGMTEERSCHVSIGVARAELPDIDMNDLVRRAERQMYDDKRRYYERTGFDRRGRLD
ncbi:GGDEF domain-containing protein [bacterium]|nr:GGDEF domain-containing protein [bacterium]